MTRPLSNKLAEEAVAAVEKYGSKSAAAAALGIPRTTLNSRYSEAMSRAASGRDPERPAPEDPKETNERLSSLVTELRARLARVNHAQSLTEEYVKLKILELRDAAVEPPEWTLSPGGQKPGITGVPILFASDWHWGEVVDPSQIGGVNQFNMEIGHRRAKRLIEKCIDLCFNHLANPEYPGIVFALGGDMVSGWIHEELEITNEKPIMPVVVDLIGVLSTCISKLADAFGRVFVPAVTGNHGRNHKRPRSKDRVFDNFDWLIYQMLAKRFEDDKRVSFLIPDGPDCLFSVYGHRYLLTHGDQFRGGDGMIGMLGPVTRGDMKKRARNAQINLEYDTMMIGHWHQLHMGTRVIVNGSLKGYDEYAAANNFGFEVPQQALWIARPTSGISFRMEVNLEDRRKAVPSKEWVAISRG